MKKMPIFNIFLVSIFNSNKLDLLELNIEIELYRNETHCVY